MGENEKAIILDFQEGKIFSFAVQLKFIST